MMNTYARYSTLSIQYSMLSIQQDTLHGDTHAQSLTVAFVSVKRGIGGNIMPPPRSSG